MQRRTFILRVLALSASLTVSIIVAEACLWWGLPIQRLRYISGRSRSVFQYDPANVRFHPLVGTAAKPNLSVRFTNWEFDTTVATNRMGFRDDDKSIEQPDVLFLGDSFAFGWGVEKSDSVEAVFEDLTGLKVLNLAFPGYGTNQEVLTLMEVCESLNIRNATAVFWYCINDAFDNRGGDFDDSPRTLYRDGRVSFTVPKLEEFEARLSAAKEEMNQGIFRYSLLADQAKRTTQKTRDLLLGAPLVTKRFSPPEPELHEDAYEMVSRTLGLLSAYAQKRSIHLAFVYIPAIDHPDVDTVYSRMASIMARNRIEFVDLRSTVTTHDYFRIDGHWTASGHQKAAIESARSLEKKGLIRSRPLRGVQ